MCLKGPSQLTSSLPTHIVGFAHESIGDLDACFKVLETSGKTIMIVEEIKTLSSYRTQISELKFIVLKGPSNFIRLITGDNRNPRCFLGG